MRFSYKLIRTIRILINRSVDLFGSHKEFHILHISIAPSPRSLKQWSLHHSVNDVDSSSDIFLMIIKSKTQKIRARMKKTQWSLKKWWYLHGHFFNDGSNVYAVNDAGGHIKVWGRAPTRNTIGGRKHLPHHCVFIIKNFWTQLRRI